MLPAHGIAKGLNLVALKFNELATDLAVQVVVLRIAVVVFIDGAAAEVHLSQEARIDQLGECAIDGGPAYFAVARLFRERGQQLVGVEVIVVAEDLLDDHPARLSVALSFGPQILLKPLEWGESDLDRTE